MQESSRDGERQAGQKVPVGVAHEGGGQGRHYEGNAVQGAGIVLPSMVRGAQGGQGRGAGATLNGKAFDWQVGYVLVGAGATGWSQGARDADARVWLRVAGQRSGAAASVRHRQ